jgi:hypothetical protein
VILPGSPPDYSKSKKEARVKRLAFRRDSEPPETRTNWQISGRRSPTYRLPGEMGRISWPINGLVGLPEMVCG